VEVLDAEEDGDQHEHHEEERVVILSALLIGVFKLCQGDFLFFAEGEARAARTLRLPYGKWSV
jgi:hypothetical protein